LYAIFSQWRGGRLSKGKKKFGSRLSFPGRPGSGKKQQASNEPEGCLSRTNRETLDGVPWHEIKKGVLLVSPESI